MSAPTIVEVEGRKLKLTNLEKVLYPATGFTKGQVVDFYVRIAPVLVPHLAGRPLTMKRYPEGVDQEYFFEKNAPDASARLGEDRAHLEREQSPHHPFHSRQRPADAGMDREPGVD